MIDGNTPRKLILTGVCFLATLLVIELLAYLVANFLASKGALYKPQSEEGFASYVARRHPVLGWVPKPNAGFDNVGSRPTPAHPDTRNPCVSLYGDSFTWSSEVGPESAWGNRLSASLKCRVHNFGVPGYGSDQAYLRFLHNKRDTAPVVVLVHLSENILRNTNRYAWLQYPGSSFSFKPRFLVGDSGNLIYVPPMQPSRETFREIIAAPEVFLENDSFVPGKSAGVEHFRFPFTVSIARTFGHISIQSKLTGKPWYTSYYDPLHETGALTLTKLIMTNFVRDARRKSRIPVVAIMPTGLDLRYYGIHGKWPYQPLLDALTEADFSVINIGDGMMKRVATDDPCNLFDDCSGHFNELGYAMVAKVLHAPLQSLVTAPQRP